MITENCDLRVIHGMLLVGLRHSLEMATYLGAQYNPYDYEDMNEEESTLLGLQVSSKVV